MDTINPQIYLPKNMIQVMYFASKFKSTKIIFHKEFYEN